MKNIEKYDLNKLEVFDIPALKGQIVCGIHSLLLFLYSRKKEDSPLVTFYYAEIFWIERRLVKKTLDLLAELEIIIINNSPQHHSQNQNSPFEIQLKTNEEIHLALGRNKKLSFDLYFAEKFTKKDLTEALAIKILKDNFFPKQVGTWVKNINNNLWNLYEFLIIAKILVYFDCDASIKTFTLQKYMGIKKENFIKAKVRPLYEKIPLEKRDIIFNQFKNTLEYLKIKTNNSFEDIVQKYLNYLLKGK